MTDIQVVKKYVAGDFVMYRSAGIYRIDDIRRENFSGMGEREYYVLSAARDPSSIVFVPTDIPELEKKMRRIMTREEIFSVIDQFEQSELLWVEETREREAKYSEILAEGDSRKILWLLKTLAIHKTELESVRRHLYASDAKLLAAAERAITDEFSFVLDIPQKEVVPYIIARLTAKQE